MEEIKCKANALFLDEKRGFIGDLRTAWVGIIKASMTVFTVLMAVQGLLFGIMMGDFWQLRRSLFITLPFQKLSAKLHGLISSKLFGICMFTGFLLRDSSIVISWI